jgi:Ser/Thr protein kinase RdoA (MazF antagonist)
MGRDLAEPDWHPLTDDELRGILGRSDPGGLGRHPAVTWRSPRPMSAAALVRHGDATVFVKRHHVSIRTPEQLAAEHDFATHLRTCGLPVPAVLRLADGESVLRRGDFCYEVHQVADGLDVYRDAVSWSPYASLGHAYAAGAALALLHLAAADFARPARPAAVLMNSCQIITAPDPLDAAGRLVATRPALAAYLAGRRWQEGFAEVLIPLIECAAPGLAALRPQWAHGDWHPSNLTWTSAAPDAQVAGIFDFGLANRTFAVHDLALALERTVVSWLDLPETGTATADLAVAAVLLDGYQTVRPLTAAEVFALPRLLPVVHIEYALSEADYFTSVAVSAANADLAYEYLIGHARWFGQPPGAALLRFLGDYCALLPVAVGTVGRAVRVVAVLLLAEPDQAGRGRQAGVVDLEGGVGDAVLAAQMSLQVGADRVAVLARGDQHVRGGGRHARRDLPDMQVVDLGHVRAAGHRRAHRRRVEPGRRRLEEDPARFADQPGARVHHQGDDDQGGDRIRPGEPGRQDDDSRHGGRGERVQVSDDVLERPGEVEAPWRAVAAGRPHDHQGGRQVDRHPGQRDGQHDAAGHLGRRHQVPDRGVAQPGREQHQRDAVGLRGQDLGPLEAVGVPAGRRPGGEPRCDQHEPYRRRVGQHVGRVGDQRERVRGQPRDDLAGHEGEDQCQGSGQPPGVRPFGPRGRAMRMPVTSRHHLTISSPIRKMEVTWEHWTARVPW